MDKANQKATFEGVKFLDIRRLVISASLGLGVLVFLFAVQSQRLPSSTVTITLDSQQVDWPYHDAVRHSVAGELESSEEALEVANSAARPGSIKELKAGIRDGQSFFFVTAVGSDSAATNAGLNEVVKWAVDRNIDQQEEPLLNEITKLGRQIQDLTSTYNSDDLASDDSLARERAKETASLIAQFERRIVVVTAELELVRPQFGSTAPASPDTSPLNPIIAGLGAFFASLGAFVLYEPRPSDPESSSE